MTRVALIGGGALAEQLAAHLKALGVEVAGAYDDTLPPGMPTPGGLMVLGPFRRMLEAGGEGFTHAMMAVGYHHLQARQEMFLAAKAAGIGFYSFVHPTACVDPSACLGEGAVVYPGCVVDMNVVLEDNVLLNNGCIVSHDSRVGGHSFIAPGVAVSGNCSVGRRNFIGTGSALRDGISTTEDCRFGVGSVVVADAAESGTYFGNPARKKQP